MQEAAQKHPSAVPHFDFDLDHPERFGLRESVLFAPDRLVGLGIGVTEGTFGIDLPEGALGLLSGFMRRCGEGRHTLKRLHEGDEWVENIAALLVEAGVLRRRPAQERRLSWDAGQPGIVRLQHASLIYRSEKATVWVDPNLHMNVQAHPGDVELHEVCDVDAVIISHGHWDHWHSPLMMMLDRDIPIIVPQVPRHTLVCNDFAKILRELGFKKVIPLEWGGKPYVVGDMEVHAFPFWGEGPLLHERTRHPHLRNWGSTYVVKSPAFTSWFLVDSGNEADGSMRDVAREVRQKFGPIDFLLSNLRYFAPTSVSYVTGGTYWLSLTADQVQRFATMARESLTLGTDGVAEICEITEARHFLPYAHWWGRLGDLPKDPEANMMAKLREELARRRAATRLIEWKLGDLLSVGGPEGYEVVPAHR